MSLTKSLIRLKETFVDRGDLLVNASCIPTNYINLVRQMLSKGHPDNYLVLLSADDR